MELSRRDLLAALGAAGLTAGVGYKVTRPDTSEQDAPFTDTPLSEHDIETLVAIGEIVYPSEVDEIEPFIRSFTLRRAETQPEHARNIAASIEYLDGYTASWYDDSFRALSPADREAALTRMDADTADPNPDGSDVERVRYYLINDLLFAFYSTPTGGRLVGIENPQGYPGGTTSYQRGPQ